jgi:L-lactate dehydrogenase complex protein LldE
MPDVALFVPCFVDQFHPAAGIAAVEVLERLSWRVHVAAGAACCGQPPTNAGYHDAGDRLLRAFEIAHRREVSAEWPIVVLSGSCSYHLRTHLANEGTRTRVHEFTAFLHDVAGLDAVASLGASTNARVAVHIGCHALRGLGLAGPSERARPALDKVGAVLAQVRGLEVAPLARADECCGFGGTFAVGEPDVAVKMGRDRLRDMRAARAAAVVTTDPSCGLHLQSVADADGAPLPIWHVAELLARRA